MSGPAKISAFVFSLALFSPVVASGAQKQVPPQDSPIALFKEIYGAYPDGQAAGAWHKADRNWGSSGDSDKVPGLATLPLTSRTAALKKRVDRKDEKSGNVCIDYDMISNSQDPDIARYRIVAPSAPPTGRARYEIYFQAKDQKGQERISYLLAQEDGKWRVEDIFTYNRVKGRTERDGARALLQNCLKN